MPARLVFRSEVRRHRAGAVLQVVVIAIASGVAMAAFAAARRSSAAYERFLAWADAPEISVGGCDCSLDQQTTAFERLRTAPFVLDSVLVGHAGLSVGFADGTHASSLAMLPAVDLEGRLGRQLPRAKVLHGRLPDTSAPFEVSVGFLAAERFGLRVGDELRLLTTVQEQSRPIAVRIVGIHAAPGELPSASGPQGASLLLT